MEKEIDKVLKMILKKKNYWPRRNTFWSLEIKEIW